MKTRKLLLRRFQKPRRKPRRKNPKKKPSRKLLSRSRRGFGIRWKLRRKSLQQSPPITPPALVAPTAAPIPPALPAKAAVPAESADRVLRISDLLRPKDALQRSMEGFLLDQRSEHTRRAYGKDLKRFIQFLHFRNLSFGPEPLTRTVVIAYKEYLLSDGLEHTTVDRHLATLRSFFNWLVDDGILEKSPADGVRFLKPKRLSTTQGFSDGEVRRVLALPNLHTRTGALHYAVLMTLFYCGLRRSELCGLRTSHLGVERGQPILRVRGKGNSERLIPAIPPVWSAIFHYLRITGKDAAKDQPLFTPIRNNRTHLREKPLDPSMIFYIVRKYAREAGVVNRVSPHSCRATAISNARDHQVSDRAIQEFAGWASADMITRYDKRKTAIENSAAKAISYGREGEPAPRRKPEFDVS